MWRHNLYLKIPLFQKSLKKIIMLTLSDLQPYLLKKSLKTQLNKFNKLSKLKIMYQNVL